MKIVRLHEHSGTGDIPIFVAHIKDGTKPISPDNPAHVFGPFATMAEAQADEDRVDDHCHKVALEWAGMPDERGFLRSLVQ